MINAEEIKKIIKLVEAVQEQHDEMDEEDTAEPAILGETFPPAKQGDMLNIADVLATCNFMFRDASVVLLSTTNEN
jgi:ATP-dependent DNA helicase 2 subunit 1